VGHHQRDQLVVGHRGLIHPQLLDQPHSSLQVVQVGFS
jgi:hypothetical protein